MKRLIGLTVVVAMVSILPLSVAHGVQVFSEDWQTGVISAADWTLRDGGGVNVSLADPNSDGDWALKIKSNGAGWGDEIYSVATYNRSDGWLTITFRSWCPHSDFPSNYNSYGGFHKNDGVGGGVKDVYGSMEGAIGYLYYDLRAAGGNDGNHGTTPPVGLPPNHMTINDDETPPGGGVITQAVSKETAIIFRITLGPTSGAEWCWSMDDGATWTVERDTRGMAAASTNSPVWVAFGAYAGGNYGSYVDDIVVDLSVYAIQEPNNGTAVSEDGPTTDTYSMAFVIDPNGQDVVVTVDPDNQLQVNNAGQGASVTLTFTSADSTVPQTITVEAWDDLLSEGAHTGTIAHSTSSVDPNYNNLAVEDVVVDIQDNDVIGVVINPTTVAVAEAGDTDTYTVALAGQPPANVTITVDPDTQLQVNTAGQGNPVNLTFTSTTWDDPQTVTVAAWDDAASEGDHTGTVSHSSAGPAAWTGLTIDDVVANITDNEPYCGEPGQVYSSADIVGPDGLGPDCYVNMYEFALMASQWLDCTDLSVPGCEWP